MVNRDYRKEVGVATGRKNVPKAVAIVILAAVAAVVVFSITRVVDATRKHHAKHAPAAATAPAD